MRNLIIIIMLMVLLLSCNKAVSVDVVTIKYVKFLEKKLGANEVFNVFIDEIEDESKIIYRIQAVNLNLEKNNLPYRFYKEKEHYIFIFNNNKITSETLKTKLENKNLFKESERYFDFEHYPEWIFILCDNEKYLLFKDSWYRPLEEIVEIKNFQCN